MLIFRQVSKDDYAETIRKGTYLFMMKNGALHKHINTNSVANFSVMRFEVVVCTLPRAPQKLSKNLLKDFHFYPSQENGV